LKPDKFRVVQKFWDANCVMTVQFVTGSLNKAACNGEVDPLPTYFTDNITQMFDT
jgi:hypothetical protein